MNILKADGYFVLKQKRIIHTFDYSSGNSFVKKEEKNGPIKPQLFGYIFYTNLALI